MAAQLYWLIGIGLSVPLGMLLNVLMKYAFHLTRPSFDDPLLALTTCMVPESRDVIVSTEEEKALWQTCFTAAPERHREFEPSSKGRKKRPAPWPSDMG